jgi:hypothetical protein
MRELKKEPPMVQAVINVALGQISIINPRQAGRSGEVDGFIVLAPAK